MKTFLAYVAGILRRIRPHVRYGQSEWIANHTGYLRFQAVVREDGSGHFHAVIYKRTGWINPRHELAVDCGTFPAFRHAMDTAYRQALELAHLRYAWVLS